LKNQIKLNEVNKPLHPSTNPKILVKIGPLAAELHVLESQPLKKIKDKKIKKTSAKYTAIPASLLSELKMFNGNIVATSCANLTDQDRSSNPRNCMGNNCTFSDETAKKLAYPTEYLGKYWTNLHQLFSVGKDF